MSSRMTALHFVPFCSVPWHVARWALCLELWDIERDLRQPRRGIVIGFGECR